MPRPARSLRLAPPSDYSVAAVDRALDLMETLARNGPSTLAQLAETTGCTRTAAFRMMRTLQARGFALQDGPRGAWRLGARIGVLGSAATAQGALAVASTPVMRALAGAIGENVYLRIRDGLESETVAVTQGTEELPVASHLGRRRPLHAGPGRLLLAFAPPALVAQALTMRLPRFTPATRTDPQWISADLKRIRERGWLITSDEVQLGVVSMTAPVRDATGAVAAALTVSSTAMRLRPPRPRALVPFVLEAAAQISQTLGAPAPVQPAAAPAPIEPTPLGPPGVAFEVIESLGAGNRSAIAQGGAE
jgi:IclR family KDG regulon transcriptional repressor